MLSKTYLKNQAKLYYKRTLAGPGKFGVFILFCILIIFSIESLGLSNREGNLEIRTINKRVIPVKIQEKKVNIAHSSYKSSSTFNNKVKISNEIDNEKRILELQRIIWKGAKEQQKYENILFIQKLESIRNKKEIEMINPKIIEHPKFIPKYKIQFFDA